MMHYKRALCFLVILFFVNAKMLFAQDPVAKHYTIEDGLPSNTIYEIYRDSKGFLWFATDKGIARYNGISFHIYTTADGLPDNEIFFFQEDQLGRIWLGSYNGELCFFKNDTFYNQKNAPYLRLPFKTSFIRFINVECDSSITIGFFRQSKFINILTNDVAQVHNVPNILSPISVYEIDKPIDEIVEIIKRPATSQFVIRTVRKEYTCNMQDVIQDSVNTAFKFRIGKYYSLPRTMFSQNQRCVYDAFHIYDTAYRRFMDFKFNVSAFDIRRIFFDKNLLFIASKAGLIINDTSVHSGSITDSTWMFRNIDLSSVTVDLAGNYWVSSLVDGAYKMNGDIADLKLLSRTYSKPINYSKLKNNCLCFVGADNVLKCLSEGDQREIYHLQAKGFIPSRAGYYLSDDSAFYFTHFYAREIIKKVFTTPYSQNISLPYYDVSGNGVRYTLGYKKRVYIVNAFLIISAYLDSLSKGVSGREIIRYENGNEVHEKTFGLSIDTAGLLWFSTTDGVYKAENKIAYRQPQFDSLKIRYFEIINGVLAGYTFDNKLFVSFNYESASPVLQYLSYGGSIWDRVTAIDKDHLLVAANDHYYILSVDKVHTRASIRQIENDFMPTRAEVFCVLGKRCYFLKDGVISSVSVRSFMVSPPAPVLFAKNVTCPGFAFVSGKPIHIPFAAAKNVSIDFDIVSPVSEDVKYEYTISKDGAEFDSWREFSEDHLSLINPSYGHYIVKIRAHTESSDYSVPITYDIFIDKPYWASLWFMGICIISLSGLGWMIARRRIAVQLGRRQKEHETEVRYMKSEYKALNALMNPHFIFNALNNVQGLVNSGDKRSANEYLRIFADLVRQNMHNVSMELISMAKELELVRNYLLLEKLRFDNKLQYSIDIDDAIDTSELLIPPLVIQPLVENAIKHGILPLQSGDGELLVKVFERGELYVVEIWDNGVGFSSSSSATDKMHKSFGLENLRKRIDYLKQINSMEMELVIEERKRNGRDRIWTVVSVSFK